MSLNKIIVASILGSLLLRAQPLTLSDLGHIGAYSIAGGSPPGAITYHNVSSERVAPSSNPETTTHTLNSTLSNGYIVAEIAMYSGTDVAVDTSPGGVTFDGSNMTLLAENNIDYFGEYRVYIFGLAVGSKVAGTYTLSVGATGSISDYNVGIVSYNGVHQTTSYGTSADASGTDSSAEVTVSSATGELVVGVCIKADETGSPTDTETERWDTVTASADTGWGGEEAGAASVNFSCTLTGSTQWLMTAVPLKPAS